VTRRSGDAWLADHSWNRPTWTVAELAAAKRGRTVSVVLPALNEAETVGPVVDTITPMLGGLVDELIVLDSGSTDATEGKQNSEYRADVRRVGGGHCSRHGREYNRHE